MDLFRVIACVAFLAALFPAGVVYAQGGTQVAVSPTSTGVAVGNIATMDVNITGGVDLNAFEITITYDPTIVSLETYAAGGYMSNLVPFYENRTNGRLEVAYVQLATPGANGDGTLMSLVFRGLTMGSSAITIESIVLANKSDEKVFPAIRNGMINVGLGMTDTATPTVSATASCTPTAGRTNTPSRTPTRSRTTSSGGGVSTRVPTRIPSRTTTPLARNTTPPASTITSEGGPRILPPGAKSITPPAFSTPALATRTTPAAPVSETSALEEGHTETPAIKWFTATGTNFVPQKAQPTAIPGVDARLKLVDRLFWIISILLFLVLLILIALIIMRIMKNEQPQGD